ncbi:2-phospho-L-lactate guanylyltransferase [Chromatiales bacterium (ex Bugula neritina AB1)]|nr:2-phospho-L-lactate guanylyltransferase [Chromatiales bacterium (ex Bugula neritina AB1)]
MTAIVIPVKPPLQGKQRLRPVFSGKQRAALVLAMLQDVLETATVTARQEDHCVWVVTADPMVQAVATKWGAGIIHEQSVNGYNAAVSTGLAALGSRYPRGINVAVIPGDIPCVTVADLTALAAQTTAETGTVRLAPSHDKRGTNGLFLSSATLLKPAFGPDSFNRYRQIVSHREIKLEIIESPTLSLDIDYPSSLMAFAEQGARSHTGVFLDNLPAGADLADFYASTDANEFRSHAAQ